MAKEREREARRHEMERRQEAEEEQPQVTIKQLIIWVLKVMKDDLDVLKWIDFIQSLLSFIVNVIVVVKNDKDKEGGSPRDNSKGRSSRYADDTDGPSKRYQDEDDESYVSPSRKKKGIVVVH